MKTADNSQRSTDSNTVLVNKSWAARGGFKSLRGLEEFNLVTAVASLLRVVTPVVLELSSLMVNMLCASEFSFSPVHIFLSTVVIDKLTSLLKCNFI